MLAYSLNKEVLFDRKEHQNQINTHPKSDSSSVKQPTPTNTKQSLLLDRNSRFYDCKVRCLMPDKWSHKQKIGATISSELNTISSRQLTKIAKQIAEIKTKKQLSQIIK